MKKEYLYDFIEKGYRGSSDYNLAVSQLIKRLMSTGNFDMASIIKNIQDANTKAHRASMKKEKTQLFSNYAESIEKNAELLVSGFKHGIIKSTILYGQPGTGKTYFVDLLSKASGLDVVKLNLSSILDFRFGESIKRLEQFIVLNKDKKQIIFLDEADSIFSRRGMNNDVFETSRIITTMLQLLDMEREALIVFSTNLIKQLDKALIRRFDLKIDFDFKPRNYKKILDAELSKYGIELEEEIDEITSLMNDWSVTISDVSLIAKRIAIAELTGLKRRDLILEVKNVIVEMKLQRTTEVNIADLNKNIK